MINKVAAAVPHALITHSPSLSWETHVGLSIPLPWVTTAILHGQLQKSAFYSCVWRQMFQPNFYKFSIISYWWRWIWALKVQFNVRWWIWPQVDITWGLHYITPRMPTLAKLVTQSVESDALNLVVNFKVSDWYIKCSFAVKYHSNRSTSCERIKPSILSVFVLFYLKNCYSDPFWFFHSQSFWTEALHENKVCIWGWRQTSDPKLFK